MEIKDLHKRNAQYNLQEWLDIGDIRKVVAYADKFQIFTEGYMLYISISDVKKLAASLLGIHLQEDEGK